MAQTRDPRTGALFDEGAGRVVSAQAGDIVQQASLTLSTSSQTLPAAPAGASRVMLQVQGGTTNVTDSTWLSFDNTVATSSDFVLRNAEDAVSSTEIILSGTFTDIQVLGTANASTLVIWWLK